MQKFKLAILDLYNGTPNQGMRAIKEILARYEGVLENHQVFDVRAKCEIPDTSFDIYISTGGPGDPLEGDGVWDKKYYKLIDKLWEHNLSDTEPKKYVFFICHSFQMACHHFGVGEITKRKFLSFGTYPTYKTTDGDLDVCLKNLPNPFWIADFRQYQVVKPDWQQIEALGAKVLCLEEFHDYLDARAIMTVRFSDEFFATQFHPEADPKGMLLHFAEEERKKQVIAEHGEARYYEMIEHLNDQAKIELTNHTIIPSFLDRAIETLKASFAVA